MRWNVLDRQRDSLALVPIARLRSGTRASLENRIRALCGVVPISANESLCRVLGRYKLYVDPTDIGIAPHLMLDGYWEMWVTEALATLVRPGMVVADIGANYGYFTLLMAELCGASGHVHAFEPNPHVSALLQQSVALNGFGPRVTLHRFPLFDTDGAEMVLTVPPRGPGGGYVVASTGLSSDDEMRMTTRRLDTMPDADRIELIKIDVETSEAAIWRGMEALVRGNVLKTVLIEFVPLRYDQPEAFLAELTTYGFSLSMVDPFRGIVAVEPGQILDLPDGEDVMLALQR